MAWFQIRKLSRLAGLVLGVVLAWVSLAPAQTITYVYDELGRLVGVVDPTQGTAIYTYDVVGNILSIQRYAANAVLLIEFTPNAGPVNTVVMLTGTGFSTTASQNTVTFNGVTATVTSSTATSIVTEVPTGATTGPIAVTTPTGSATSRTNFVVGSTGGAPTISSFTPTIGTPGTAVTVTGTNFDRVLVNDKLLFNKTRSGAVSSATATSLATTVPNQVGSGQLTLTTPGGTVTTGSDFFVPPSPFVVSDVQVTGRLTVATAKTITISTQLKIGLLVFDGTAGQGVQLELSGMTTLVNANVSIYKPDGAVLASTGIVKPGGMLQVLSLPVTGTYSVVVAAVSTYTGSVTLKFGAPDLIVTAVTVPTTPISAQADGTYVFIVNWTVKNQGNLAAQPAIFDRLYLSTNTTLGAGDIAVGGASYPQVLAPNATYTLLALAEQIPATVTPGTYYILVETDSASPGWVPESNEANNVKASSAITLLGLPDLTVTALTVPTTPIGPNRDGTYSLPISYTVLNQGQSTPQQGWSDGLYLSTDTTWDAGDRQIWAQQQNINVPGGTTHTNTPTGIVPVGQAPGDYYVIAYTDRGAFLKETNETNNTKVSVTRVTLLPLPDLTPTALTVPTTPIGPNQDGSYDIPVSFTVANQGAGPAQAYWWDGLYLSADAVPGGTDIIRDIVRGTAVLAGASYSQSATIRDTGVLSPGDYYVILKTDNYSYVVETNEGNNTLVSTTRVTLGPRPDLVPTALTVPTAPVSRNADGTYDIPVSFTVANRGAGDAKPYWWDSFYLSADAVLGGGDINIRDISRVTAVLAGASYSQSATIRTGVLSPGDYYVILKTDNYSYLLEANEGNNVLVSATRITLAP